LLASRLEQRRTWTNEWILDADTKEELEKVLADTWAETSMEYCNALARSMPARIHQELDRNGAYTDY
jgi:hypothetical protein